MIRRHRFAVLLAVVALALGACSRNDAKESDVVNAMTDAKLTQTQAKCIGNGIDDAFSDDQKLYNQVASASSVDDLPEGTEGTIQDVLDDCLGETPDSSDDSTTTTEAGAGGGADTTATTASGG
jgi:hypothetical protein